MQAAEKEVGGLKRIAVAAVAGRRLHDTDGDDPGLGDVRRSLFCTQGPADGPAVTVLVIRCHEKDSALAQELTDDLELQRLLVGLDGQEEVGLLLM